MSATVSNNMNHFIKGDKVKINDKLSYFHKKKGKIVSIMGTLVEVKCINMNPTIILHFTKVGKYEKLS